MGLPCSWNDLASGCYIEGQERKGWGHPPKVSQNTHHISAKGEIGKIKGVEDSPYPMMDALIPFEIRMVGLGGHL